MTLLLLFKKSEEEGRVEERYTQLKYTPNLRLFIVLYKKCRR